MSLRQSQFIYVSYITETAAKSAWEHLQSSGWTCEQIKNGEDGEWIIQATKLKQKTVPGK